MAVPLKWNTLDQAAKWLSEKTKEDWTPNKIIRFAIDQCRPDNIVEDYKYPSYLRAIFPEAMRRPLVWISIRLDGSPLTWVYDEIQTKDRKITTTFLFKDNLIELESLGKTAIHYVSVDDHLQNEFPQLTEGEAKPIVIYCELHPLYIDLEGESLKFPILPPIQVSFETLGLRDEELKLLLRDYLALPKQKSGIKNVISYETDKEIKHFIAYFKTINGWERDDFVRPILSAIEETNSFDGREVFPKLKEFAENGKHQLKDDFYNNGYISVSLSGNKRTKLHRKDLSKRLKRIEEKYTQWQQFPSNLMSTT